MTASVDSHGFGEDDVSRVKRRSEKVDVEELLSFIFPSNLQHPLSTGRLYAFGIYGPLDEEGNLRAGHKGRRVVSGWELDTMCLKFEREDILQVYIPAERPLFTLSEAQKEEIVAQADSHLKTAKGRGYRRQVTRDEVTQLLSGLPRETGTGFVSFHDAQALIVSYRETQIARFKVIFPNLVSTTSGGERGGAPVKKQRASSAVLVSQQGVGDGLKACESNAENIKPRDLDSSGQETRLVKTGGPSGKRAGDRLGRRRAKFSLDVAPAEMFIKDAGFTPAGMAKHTNKLLNTRAYKVGNIADGNNPAITQNVRLIREDHDYSNRQQCGVRRLWDDYVCLRGNNIGAHVRSARSSTTAKRKA